MDTLTRRTLLAASLSTLPGAVMAQAARVPGVAPPVQSDRADLAKVEGYLRSLRSLHARFIQVGPDGGTLTGQAWLQRPNRMRFQYDPPAPYLLVANGNFVVFHDSRLKQTSNIPLGQTPLGILLQDRPSFGGDVSVLGVQCGRDVLQVSVARAGRRGDGTLTLEFVEEPLRLSGWTVTDAQGARTQVTLRDVQTGGTAEPSLFQFVDPRFFENNQGGGG